MAEIATYTWSSFNEENAKFGLRVGFRQTNDYDLSMTGILSEARRYTKYQTVIDGRTLFINNFGVVQKTFPESNLVGQTVMIVTSSMRRELLHRLSPMPSPILTLRFPRNTRPNILQV